MISNYVGMNVKPFIPPHIYIRKNKKSFYIKIDHDENIYYFEDESSGLQQFFFIF